MKSSVIVNGRLVGRAVVAALRFAASGMERVDSTTHLARSVQCSLCPRWDAHQRRCLECGCYAAKHWMASEKCPLGRW